MSDELPPHFNWDGVWTQNNRDAIEKLAFKVMDLRRDLIIVGIISAMAFVVAVLK